MAEELSTERLESVLLSIGHHLEIPRERSEPVTVVLTHERRRMRRLLVAASSLAVAITGAVLIPSTRAALADLLGIGSTRIEITGDEPAAVVELPHIAHGLTQISADEASRILGGELPDASGTTLGAPQAVYQMPEGGVLLAWRDDTATLWVRAADDTEILLRKLIGTGESVTPVNDLGTEALIITGAHMLQTPQRQLAAQRVLLWYDDEYEYRLEADMAPAALVDAARNLQQ